jgi:hypothetical protein
MYRSLQNLIERQIQKARLLGQLDGLAGEGKPLADHTGDVFVDIGDAVGFRMMAQAGVLPAEIEIKKQIELHQKALASITDVFKRKKAMSELAQLELRYNIAREARQKFMR